MDEPRGEVTIETSRLLLREMHLGDLDFITEVRGDPETMRYYPQTYSRAECQTWIEKQLMRYARDGFGQWLVSMKATGEPVGFVGPMVQQVEHLTAVEIGWTIHRQLWRNGYASEAAAAVREWVFEQTAYPFVISLIRPINEPSAGVARKLGMRLLDRTVNFHGLEHLVYESRRSDAPQS